MKAILCLALILVSSFAVELRKQPTIFAQTSSRLSAAMDQINANPFGQLIMSLAEIHMATAGPLEDLKQALADLETATVDAINSENESFETATKQHNSEVGKWETLIASAAADISATQATLNNILYPRRDSLEAEIKKLEDNIADNIQTTEKETKQREEAHEEFLRKENEYELAIEAAEEALNLLKQLRNGEASLAQVRVAQNSLKKVQEKVNKLQNNKYATFIKALTQIAQNFADQEVLQKVIKLVTDLKLNCEEGLEQLRQAEEDAKNVWENERLPQLQRDLKQLETSRDENKASLKSTNGNYYTKI